MSKRKVHETSEDEDSAESDCVVTTTRSQLQKKKRIQVFLNIHTDKCPTLFRSQKGPSYACCTLCDSDFSVGHAGSYDCKGHIENTPQAEYYYLHMTSWVLNIFGIFFILAAHEHYSIDVFIAFYITSRLFMYYHTLANNRSLMQQDAQRTRVWFPMFSFFESRCDGMVPNEFEWPFRMPDRLKELLYGEQSPWRNDCDTQKPKAA